MNDKIINSVISDEREELSEAEQKRLFRLVYDQLIGNGYNPISQIVGYLISEDPTYITDCNNARAMIQRIDRDRLLADMVKDYLEIYE